MSAPAHVLGRAAACAVVALAACASEPPDVLLITVDTLRPDHLSLYGYPRETTPEIDAFFSNAAVFTRAYSTEANTSPSVASLLTGLAPQDHGVRLLYQLVDDDLVLLPERLPPAYETAAFVSNAVLTNEAMGMADRFDHFDDFVDEREPKRVVYERNATRTTDAVLTWLPGRSDPDRPLFLWVHYIDPHGPYRPPESWPRRFRHDEPAPIDLDRVYRYQQIDGVDDGRAYVDAYDEETRYADHEIGRLLRGYARHGALDDAFVVFTADHGESMMEHERFFAHGYQVYEEIIRVPLMIRGPGIDAGRRDDPVSGIDILPTILGFVGAEIPSRLPGFDLANGEVAGDRVIFAEATGDLAQWRAAIQQERKWVVGVRGPRRRIVHRRFYDLTIDPGEIAPERWAGGGTVPARLLDLVATDPDPAGRPKDLVAGQNPDAPKVAPGVDAEGLERLRALGYVR